MKATRQDICWMQVARDISTLSKDPSTKVGAVVIKPGINHPLSTGYNGMPIGVPDVPERWERPEKYNWFCHAEFNAVILPARRGTVPLEGSILYVTHMPCVNCMLAIVQSGLSTVYVDLSSPPSVKYEAERQKALEIAQAAGVRLYGLAGEEVYALY